MYKILHSATQILTLRGSWEKDGRNLDSHDLCVHEQSVIVHDEETINWIGEERQLPSHFSKATRVDCTGLIITPELVDCHTHMIFAGDRSEEYAKRMNGLSYQQIAKAGGGILYTMDQTRKASDEKLYQLTKQRILSHYKQGIATIEIKSGYGLSYEHEYRLSHIIHRLKKELAPKIQIINTYMAAHACPPEYPSSQKYLYDVVYPLMEKLSQEKIIDIVDIFHEPGYFSHEEAAQFFQKAKSLGLKRKSHADEFADDKGAALASLNQALSTDHLLASSEESIRTLAETDTVAVMLPGTGYFLGKPQAHARKFLDAGAKVAIGSDFNPGSCHWSKLIQIASLAALHPHYKMNQAELWSSITLNAAHSLGLKKQGALKEGLKARFSFFKAPSLHHITYHWGENFSANSDS